ncbi:MAG TPA: hypothetical protein VG839_03975 [Asticcacaulis sp.]|nr:hypothetical protein [Asticcacaulis sp.]
MKLAVSKGLLISLPALTIAMWLGGCATEAPPPPPPPLPPPAPAGPPVALASEISDAASTYIDYIHSVRDMSAAFGDGNSVQASLQSGASFEPKQLSEGAIAYGAIVAMQEPSFRSALRAYASSDTSRADLVSRILADPSYAAALPDADIAARRIILALSSDGQSVYRAGSGVKQAAYDIQHQSWSKLPVVNPDARLALAKQNSVTLKSVQTDESARLLTAALTGTGLVTPATTGQSTGGYVIQGDSVSVSAGGGQSSLNTSDAPAAAVGAPAPQMAEAAADKAVPAAAEADLQFDRPDLFNAPYTDTVNRSLAIAAIAMLGEGGENHADTLVGLLDNRDGEKCLNMSKLNLYQCLAVAKPYYEDVFCLGQHILMDTGQCLGKMSSNALSFEPVLNIGFNDDGSVAHADAEPYLKPAPPVKCKKGHKCKATPASTTTTTTKAAPKKATGRGKGRRH